MPAPPTVLIVEDEEAFRRSLVAYLEDSGYRVLEAVDGCSGLEIFRRERPDLVLTDLRMPVMDGLEMLAALRDISPATPVVVISGTERPNLVQEALALGARQCLLKPISDLGLLAKAVEDALGAGNPMQDERAKDS